MTNEEVKSLLEEVMNSNYDPNEWESNFVDSVLNQIENGFMVSEKQAACITRLYKKATGSYSDDFSEDF